MLLLYCSIYTYELADATLQGDQEQLEWIKDGRAGKGKGIRMFKTYPKSYIDGLEEKLLLEQNHMYNLSTSARYTSIFSFLLFCIFLFLLFRERGYKIILHKNDGFYFFVFYVLVICFTFGISTYFSAGDWLSPNESQDLSLIYEGIVFFASPLFFGLSTYLIKKEMSQASVFKKWKYYMSLVFFILSIIATLILLIGFLSVPDLGGNIT
jgi:hypothetical protein